MTYSIAERIAELFSPGILHAVELVFLFVVCACLTAPIWLLALWLWFGGRK